MKIKNFIKDKGIVLYLVAIGVLCCIVAMIFAIMATLNDGTVSVSTVVVSIIAVCVAAITLFFDYNGFGKMVAAGLYMCAFGLLVSSQLGNLGYYVYDIIDIGNGLQTEFVVGSVLYVTAIIFQSVAVFYRKNNKNNTEELINEIN